MAFGRVLLAVFVSCVAVALAGNGKQCSNDVTNGLRIFPVSDFTDLAANKTIEHINIVAHPRVEAGGVRNDGPINAYEKGTCQFWGKDAAVSGYQDVVKMSWVEWDLGTIAASSSVQVFIQLTEPQSKDKFSTRLTIVSMLATVPQTGNTSPNWGKCNPNKLATQQNWNCEAFIIDSCQGYGESDQKVWTFTGGRRYFLIFDSPHSAADNFHIKLIPRNGLVGRQDWESGVTPTTGSIVGVLPNGWTRNNNNWDVFSTLNYKIRVPGWTTWPDWNGPLAQTYLVGEIGANIIMNIPNYIRGQNEESGITCQSPGQAANCNHTDDNLYSPVYTTVAGKTYDLELESFWYDGRTDSNSVASGTAQVFVSATADGPWELLHTMESVFNTLWVVERAAIPTAISDTGSVYFKFHLSSNDNKLGWALNAIEISPRFEIDQCYDGVECTEDACSNAYVADVDSEGNYLYTYTQKHFGCYNPDDKTTCNKKTVDCEAYVCNSDKNAAGVDEDGCDTIRDPSNCDDGIPCTNDVCDDAGKCHNNPRPSLCNDGRGCTQDFCLTEEDTNIDLADGEGCYFEATCSDGVDCTIDTCEEAAIGGDKCLHTIDFNLCEDFIDCTYELVCDPEQPGMDPVSGCIRIPMDDWCNDHDACTIDTCEPYSEAAGRDDNDRCVHTEMNCDDCITCTVDSCEEGECVNTPSDEACDDGIPCTDDVCNAELGKCQNIPVNSWCYEREDLDACDVFECRPHQVDSDEYGCIAKTKHCDDDLACTVDTCVDGECEHEAHDEWCDDGEGTCTDDYCSKDLHKCVNLPNSDNCDDNSVCTINFCGRDGKCHFPEIDCSDDIYCTVDSCDPIDGCAHEAMKSLCEDEFACTIDECDVNLGGCTNIPSNHWCTEHKDKCHTWFCNTPSGDEDGCQGIPVDCNDGIPCTNDECDMATGECEHIPDEAACDDDHDCTVDVCDPIIGCVNTPTNSLCNDKNDCTIDICGCDGECYNTEIVCDDNIACTNDKCEPFDGQCHFYIEEGSCDDDIACTVDECDLELGQCTNIETDANCLGQSVDGCYIAECTKEDKGCVYHAKHYMCDDHIPCTYDFCDGSNGCKHVPYDSLCNDGHDCTMDSCSVEHKGCVFEPVNDRCNDGYNCTSDYCSTETGCHNVADHNSCDDGIDCTDNVCSADNLTPSGCSFPAKNSWCDDGVGCTKDTCEPDNAVGSNACKHTAVPSRCNDGWDCSDDTCDLSKGCQYDDSSCPWHVQREALCLECTTSSAQILQLNYTDGTGAMQFATRNAESDELKANIVALPTDQVIIGASSQEEVHVGSDDGLVINDNIRLVPLDADEDDDGEVDIPTCNEIRRGSIIVVPVAVQCGENTCHRDTVQVCSKQQDYEWVTL